MIKKNYQRKHLRAPFKDNVLYTSGEYVLRASTLNISEGGILIDELPSFPEKEDVNLMICLPNLPFFKNFSLLRMQTFTRELFPRHVIRARAKLVRREELALDIENVFKSRFGLEFASVDVKSQQLIADYVTVFSSNLIFLQTLIDSFNTDEDTKSKVWALAQIMGYKNVDKISHLRSMVGHDYKSLQWI